MAHLEKDEGWRVKSKCGYSILDDENEAMGEDFDGKSVDMRGHIQAVAKASSKRRVTVKEGENTLRQLLMVMVVDERTQKEQRDLAGQQTNKGRTNRTKASDTFTDTPDVAY